MRYNALQEVGTSLSLFRTQLGFNEVDAVELVDNYTIIVCHVGPQLTTCLGDCRRSYNEKWLCVMRDMI